MAAPVAKISGSVALCGTPIDKVEPIALDDPLARVSAPFSVSVPSPVLLRLRLPKVKPFNAKSPPLVSAFITSQSLNVPDQPLLMFSVSVPSPPSIRVTPDSVVPEPIVRVSSPAPSQIAPVTNAPLDMVTLVSPAVSAIAYNPFTRAVDSKVIVSASPVLDTLIMPIPIPMKPVALTSPETVMVDGPVPSFMPKMP